MYKKTYILLIISMLYCIRLTAQEPKLSWLNYLDSCIAKYHQYPDSDTSKMIICYRIAREHHNVDSTIMWSERLMRHAQYHNSAKYQCEALGFISWAYYFKNNSLKGIEINRRGIELSDSINDLSNKAYFLYMLGYDFYYIKDYIQADEYFNEALQIYEQINDSALIGNTLRGMASNYCDQKAYALAEQTFSKSVEIAHLSHNHTKEALAQTSLAECKLMQYNEKFLTKNISKVLEAKHDVLKAQILIQDNITECFSDYNLRCKANYVLLRTLFYELRYFDYKGQRRKELLDSIKDLNTESAGILADFGETMEYGFVFDTFRANYHTAQRNYGEALQILDSLQSAGNPLTNDYSILYDAYLYCYTEMGDYQNCTKYSQLIADLITEKTNVDFAVLSAQKIIRTDYERQAMQREQRSRDRIYLGIIIGIIVTTILIVVTIGYFHKRQHIKALAITNKELDSKNRNITSSINYARLIQSAVQPNLEDITCQFADSFLIYKPLYIVSGDFYWTAWIDRRQIIACADCTGHGVPGAFVSLLGISLLNEIAATMPADGNAAYILNELKPRLMKSLHQDRRFKNNEVALNTDGMDIALVIIDHENKKMDYAGAYRPLWIWRNGELLQYKYDRMPIGLFVGPDSDFTNHEISIQKDDILYMFSDGITDQMGFTDDTHKELAHFSTKRFAKLIEDVAPLPLSEQKSRIEDFITKWQNGYRQLDDILLMGLKVR